MVLGPCQISSSFSWCFLTTSLHSLQLSCRSVAILANHSSTFYSHRTAKDKKICFNFNPSALVILLLPIFVHTPIHLFVYIQRTPSGRIIIVMIMWHLCSCPPCSVEHFQALTLDILLFKFIFTFFISSHLNRLISSPHQHLILSLIVQMEWNRSFGVEGTPGRMDNGTNRACILSARTVNFYYIPKEQKKKEMSFEYRCLLFVFTRNC